MEGPFAHHRLANGLRLFIEPMSGVRSVACGYLARAGSRDETPETAGVSHFLEHMCFKGTPRRSWERLTADFDRLGSIYNAFTWKDKTAYYGWVPVDELEPQLELLTDMMEATLPGEEFDTEKQVILEEIAQSGDDLQHHLVDLVFEKMFAGHPLSWPVLGHERTVGRMTREQMAEYHRSRYSADNLMLIVAGRVDPGEVISLAERICGELLGSGGQTHREPPALREGTAVQQLKRFNQQALAMVFPAPPAGSEHEEDAQALAAILGGSNSRIYWNVMQEGLSASAGATHLDFHDCGLLAISAICEPANCESCTEALQAEAENITQNGVLEKEVQRVRNKRRTSLAVEAEAPYYRLMQLMDDIDYHGGPRTIEQRLAAVDAVTTESIARCLEKFPITERGYFVSVGPRDWPEL
ncbi:MAG: insulinase family protein [Phycisphaerales bacterium]|nr:MAG: insulinase family protein [Phycisphaerales bacterium]